MYEAFFEMQRTPFVRNIPPEFLYESADIAEVLARLEYVARNRQFAVVTGQPGCGKSTLIRRFAASLSKQDFVILYLSDSKLTPRWFYKGMLDQLGIEAKFYRGDTKRQLQEGIEILQGIHGKHVVCILDEAHLLEKETIEEFRFMLNYRFDSESPMALILSGQSEFWDKMRMQRYSAVKQRIDMVCTLNPLDLAETAKYIQSHLVYAGGKMDIFTDCALNAIYESSSGIPRMINRLCEKSLIYAFQQSKRLIDEHIVFYVAEHEMLESYHKR